MLNCLVDLKPNKDYRRYITLGVIKWRYLLLRLLTIVIMDVGFTTPSSTKTTKITLKLVLLTRFELVLCYYFVLNHIISLYKV